MASKILELSDSLKAKLAEIAKGLESGKTLRVGFLEGSTETKGGEVVSVPMIAAIQNFGAPRVGIPPRPFFNNFLRDYEGTWGNAIALNLKKYNYDAGLALRTVGEGMRVQLQQSITDTNTPALSPVTLMLRKMRSEGGPNFIVNRTVVNEARAKVDAGESYAGVSTKPLIDSGQMQQAVDFEVVA